MWLVLLLLPLPLMVLFSLCGRTGEGGGMGGGLGRRGVGGGGWVVRRHIPLSLFHKKKFCPEQHDHKWPGYHVTVTRGWKPVR